MAITTTEIKKQYTPATPTNSFPFDIVYFEDEDINVEIVDSEGITTSLTLDAVNNGFSVTAVNDNPQNGASIDTTETYTSGETVTIYRRVPVTQENEFVRGATLPPELLNTSFDRGVAISQEINETSDRHITTPITDPDGLNYELPVVELRKNKVVGFDGTGEVIAVDVGEGGGLVGVNTTKGLVSNSGIVECKVDDSTIEFDGQGIMNIKSVGNAEIRTNAVGTDEIQNNAVTTAKMAEMVGDSGDGGYVLGNMVGAPQSPYGVYVDGDTTLAANSQQKLVTQGAVKEYVDTKFTGYESSDQAIPDLDIDLTVTHGLGGSPKWSQCVLKCTTAEHGYSIGDEVILANDYGDSAVTITVWQNATELGFRRSTNYFYIVGRDSNSHVNLNETNWRLVFRAWK